jgi:uncharacterized protein
MRSSESETRPPVPSWWPFFVGGRPKQALAQTVLVENARTLQDLVREMLRPMLKSWLDDNLPTLVERLVLAEIERMTGSRSAG